MRIPIRGQKCIFGGIHMIPTSLLVIPINSLFIRYIWVCFSELIWTMKMKRIFWVSVCLLFTCASLPLNAEEDEEDLNPEEDEHSNIPGKMLDQFLFLN